MLEILLVPEMLPQGGPPWAAIRTDTTMVVGVGNSAEEALDDLLLAADEYARVALEKGWEIPQPLNRTMAVTMPSWAEAQRRASLRAGPWRSFEPAPGS